MKYNVENRDQLTRVASALAAACSAGPTVVLFFGPVGAGKTTLIQSLMLALGSREVSSPTYALHQTYRYGNDGQSRAEHLDLYRVENEDDLESVGLWDLLSGSSALVLIEWAEKLALPLVVPGRQVLRVDIHMRADGVREVVVQKI